MAVSVFSRLGLFGPTPCSVAWHAARPLALTVLWPGRRNVLCPRTAADLLFIAQISQIVLDRPCVLKHPTCWHSRAPAQEVEGWDAGGCESAAPSTLLKTSLLVSFGIAQRDVHGAGLVPAACAWVRFVAALLCAPQVAQRHMKLHVTMPSGSACAPSSRLVIVCFPGPQLNA